MATKTSGEFEKALARLEEIVKRLEEETTSLDDSVALYREGIGLAKRCDELLRDAKSAIETAQNGPATVAAPVNEAASGGLFSDHEDGELSL